MAKANTTSKSAGRGTKPAGSGAKKSAKKIAKSGSGAGSGASKKTAKKPATKKTTKKAAAKKMPSSGAAKKSVSKKKTAKKAPTGASKGSAGQAPASKAPAKSPAAKKATGKADAKKSPAKAAPGDKASGDKKAPSKKSGSTAPAETKASGGKSGGASAPSKPAEDATGADGAAADGGDDKKSNRKGITIVSKKPAKKSKASKPTPKFPPTSGMLLGPGSPIRRPLIPSGPSAPPPEDDTLDTAPDGKKKSPFNKRELDRFRKVLLVKRAELIGDLSAIEAEALLGNAGDLSSLPQHLAEQGSDSYERSLSLDLAAADRRLIKEIDDALQRIDEGVYGLCEATGKPIRKARLEELPWARHSIEAARAIERSGHLG